MDSILSSFLVRYWARTFYMEKPIKQQTAIWKSNIAGYGLYKEAFWKFYVYKYLIIRYINKIIIFENAHMGAIWKFYLVRY